jgi:hypothetical protein
MTFLLMRRFPASYHITYIAYVTNGKLLRPSLNCRLIPRNLSAKALGALCQSAAAWRKRLADLACPRSHAAGNPGLQRLRLSCSNDF